MLLVVAPTGEEVEALRRVYVKLHCFVYCATYQNFIRSAEKYTPDAILLKVNEVTDLIVEKMRRVREILTDVPLITLSDVDVSALAPNLTYSTRPHMRTLLFQHIYFSKRSPYASALSGSLMISGLLLHPYDKAVFLCGQPTAFTPEEVYLLRYLAEIHPRRADWPELGRHCFTYGKRTPRSSVAARISRINKEAKRRIFLPLITYRRGEGYGIDL